MNLKWSAGLSRVSLVVVILAISLSACAQMAAPQEAVVSREVVKVEQPALGLAPAPGAKEGEVSTASDIGQTIERIVIKNASLSIVVANPVESMDSISRLAEELGGYVVTANMYKERLSSGLEVPRASITIRVPAEKLNQALARIRSESSQEPLNENINSQDVTNEYVDLKSRLRNLEAAEAELTKIMQDARRTEDVLAVYNQLVQIREQIEVIKGQINYYDQTSRFSAISVELIADKAVQPIQIAGWKPEGIAKEAVEALIKTTQTLISVLIWIVIYILPVLLILCIIFILPPVLLFRAWRRRRAKRKAAITPQSPPQAES